MNITHHIHEAEHTAGPLTAHENGDANSFALLGDGGRWLISLLHNGEAMPAQQRANMQRLAACWNALVDLPQAALDGGWTRAGLEAHGVAMQRERDEALAENARLRKALAFYANRSHFLLSDEDAWDTVSGEPTNFHCDEAGTATVEDGTVAAMALVGTPMPDDVEGEMRFWRWLYHSCPAPVADEVRRLWMESDEYRAWVAMPATLAEPGGIGRDAFEAAYAAHMEVVSRMDCTAEEVRAMRVADDYKHDAAFLSGCWRGWRLLAGILAHAQPNMFWNDADPELSHDSIHEVIDREFADGVVDVGDVVEVQRAIRLPNVRVRVVADPDDEDSFDYEVVKPGQEGGAA